MGELHIVKGDFFWHAEESDQLAPMLLLERFAGAEFNQRPGLLVFLNLLL
jgi:hypothetical protein